MLDACLFVDGRYTRNHQADGAFCFIAAALAINDLKKAAVQIERLVAALGEQLGGKNRDPDSTVCAAKTLQTCVLATEFIEELHLIQGAALQPLVSLLEDTNIPEGRTLAALILQRLAQPCESLHAQEIARAAGTALVCLVEDEANTEGRFAACSALATLAACQPHIILQYEAWAAMTKLLEDRPTGKAQGKFKAILAVLEVLPAMVQPCRKRMAAAALPLLFELLTDADGCSIDSNDRRRGIKGLLHVMGQYDLCKMVISAAPPALISLAALCAGDLHEGSDLASQVLGRLVCEGKLPPDLARTVAQKVLPALLRQFPWADDASHVLLSMADQAALKDLIAEAAAALPVTVLKALDGPLSGGHASRVADLVVKLEHDHGPWPGMQNFSRARRVRNHCGRSVADLIV